MTVSLLSGHELASAPEDWVLGEHGVTIEFDIGGAQLRATYLPYVAAAQGWSRRETLAHLVKKAGYGGALELVLADLRVTRFRASVATLSFAEYVAHRAAMAPALSSAPA